MKYCAVFDFDETIIKTKSMIVIMQEYYLHNSLMKCFGYIRFKLFQLRLLNFSKKNNDRTELNRFYYQQLTGISAKKMLRTSENWFAKNKEKIFNLRVLAEIEKHRKCNAEIIVVTGSFYECIAPIINYLGLKHVICALLIKKNDIYTGEMEGIPTIGQRKADALKAFLKHYGFSLQHSYAYGDHESDISMLSLADNPVAVGKNVVLQKHARENNWLIID